MTIRSRVVTDEYREGWERVFGERRRPRIIVRTPADLARLNCMNLRAGDVVQISPDTAIREPLNPHDADDHPAAD